MATYILIFDVVKVRDFEFKSHYRLYNDNKSLITEGDYTYKMKKHKPIIPAVLKSRITTGIWFTLKNKRFIDMGKDRYSSSCLVSNEVIRRDLEDCFKAPKEHAILDGFTKKVEVEDDPRIYRVVLINGNYTIIKSDSKYLTREQAKEELFNRQLEEA